MSLTEQRAFSVRPSVHDPLASPEKGKIRDFFDSIAHRYDFLNSLLSFNLDEAWRRKARRLILEGGERRLLDLGVGTGKFLSLFLKAKKWDRAIGVDFSSAMLEKARHELSSTARFVSADFHHLPFRPESFDLIVSSFTLRSVKDMPLFLNGVYDLLVERGKAAFLCLTRPSNFLWKLFYYPYLQFYLPFIGGLFSGNQKAYQFLSQSVQSFQDPTRTIEQMRRAGFSSISAHAFSFGFATLVIGKK